MKWQKSFLMDAINEEPFGYLADILKYYFLAS